MKPRVPELSLKEYWTNWQAIPFDVLYKPLYDFLAQEFKNGDIFVEVGGLIGKSASYIARRTTDLRKDVTIIVVDSLFGVSGNGVSYLENIYGSRQAKAMLDNFEAVGIETRCHLLTMPSPHAAKVFADNSLAAVFIDGDHDYEPAKADIRAWWSKVKPGGYLCGHYYCRMFPGVVRAVTEMFGGDLIKAPVQVVKADDTFSVRKPF